MFKETINQLQKNKRRKWNYIKENVVCDELGRKNYTRHIFYRDTDGEPEFVVDIFKHTFEISDKILDKTKKERAIFNNLVAKIAYGGD